MSFSINHFTVHNSDQRSAHAGAPTITAYFKDEAIGDGNVTIPIPREFFNTLLAIGRAGTALHLSTIKAKVVAAEYQPEEKENAIPKTGDN